MDRYPDPVPEDLSETDGGPAPEEPSGSRLHPDVTQHLFDVVSPLFRRVDMIFVAVIKAATDQHASAIWGMDWACSDAAVNNNDKKKV